MRIHRIALFLAGFAAAAAGPAVPRASADEKDELAEGDWTGVQDWQHKEASGDATDSTVNYGNPGPTGGAAAAPSSDPASTGTPPPSTTPPTGTKRMEAVPGGEYPTGEPGDGEPADPPAVPPPAPTTPPATGPATPGTPVPSSTTGGVPAACHAHWACETMKPAPDLYEKETLLTLVLFRTDSFAFVCNGYARSESTWYVDWFATTAAQHDGQSRFLVVVHLVDACPLCKPTINLLGCSELVAKALVKTQWGGVDESTCASSSSLTQWAGDVDCSDSCSAAIRNVQAGGQTGVGVGELKVTTKETKSYMLVDSPGGRTAASLVKADRTELMIVDRGAVSTYAGGTEDNAEAKTMAGYRLRIRGESCCGPWGEYVVELKAE